MSDEKNWVDALKIDPEKLSGWSAQVPEGVPILVWCLQHGHISLEDYMSWACETFQMPRLNSEYFQTAFDPAILPPDRGNSVWSSWCFPVGQWEELSYVACIEPPREVPTGNYVFVLADPSVMAAVWNEGLTGTGKTATPAHKNSSAVGPELPDGMNLKEIKPFKLNLGTNSAINIVPLAGQAPEPPASDAELPPTPKTVAQSKGATELVVPPPPEDVSPGEDQEIDLAFRQLKEHYQMSMILKIEGSQLRMYRSSPNQDLSALTDKDLVDLSAPSLFRIVHKTGMPYHGYVVDSELHREFFKTLGHPQLPATVTAAPLKTKQGFWGVLLALGHENAQRPKALQSVENAAEKLTGSLAETWQKAG